MTQTSLPDFGDPPINEVAIGLRFPVIAGLHLPHIGLFWSDVKGQFGSCEEASPLGPLEELHIGTTGAPLPRTWLIHDSGQYLIQLQPNIFFFNWRRRDEHVDYPRFAKIKQLFDEYLERYFEFLASENLKAPEAVSCELSYVNLIPTGQEALVDASTLFCDHSWFNSEGRFLHEPKAYNWQTTYDLPQSAGELAAKIHSVKLVADGSPAIRFEMSARNSGHELHPDETTAWFDLAHETIVQSFADLTNADVQREIWGRTDGSA